MDFYGTDRKLSELGESDFNDLLDHDMFDGTFGALPAMDEQYSSDCQDWLESLFEDPVLNDKMMSDALHPPQIKSEHSYSLSNDANGQESKTESGNNEMDIEYLTETPQTKACDLSKKTLDQKSTSSSSSQVVMIKQEPRTEIITTSATTATTILKQPTIVLTTTTQPISTQHRIGVQQPVTKHERMIVPKYSIKLEPHDLIDSMSDTSNDHVSLPPTPPSSNNSSDSEGGQSPLRSAPSSPIRHTLIPNRLPQTTVTCRTYTSQPLFSSPVRVTHNGVLVLTEEEKRTLITEGYPIPQKLPLTKQEEKNLKKIRRKIKNKISAQESRRKKKEYLETLEKKVEAFTHENGELKRKVDSLEGNNRSLLSQLQKLQSLVGKVSRPSAVTSTQTGTCLMVLVLCFAMFMGSWSPSTILNIGYTNTTPELMTIPKQRPSLDRIIGPDLRDPRTDAYSTPNKRSRVLLSMMEDLEDHSLYEPYGPNMPFMNKDDACDNNDEEYKFHDPGLPKAAPLPESEMPPSSSGDEGGRVVVVKAATKANDTRKEVKPIPDIAAEFSSNIAVDVTSTA
ncbi:cyclic AMP-responsive element-binding protein 3-like protein 2 [Tubulanus polymorphus]|uniref:cyclic AMP-responsive element-binding protein 3-like protein 2 n=1 Tax=Tubulanus polymorphus TaxID=672921 RepID=UPI003DA5B6B8